MVPDEIVLLVSWIYDTRYMDGECLTVEDEKVIVEKLLAYHPHSEDKIGCGIESIMVSLDLNDRLISVCKLLFMLW